jgi:hypothetical protein
MFTYLRSLRIVLFVSFLLIIPLLAVGRESSFRTEMFCEKSSENESSCTFSCRYLVAYGKNQSAFIRNIVSHSVWTAIYDKTTSILTNQYYTEEITLPKRDYNYVLKSNSFDKSGRVGAMDFSIVLDC